jgi:acyl-coenzyme A thioesterase PaaI-like protein
MKPGKNTIFAEAEVRNGEGALVAKAIGTLRARYPEK